MGLAFYDESSDLVKNNQNNDLNGNKLTKVDKITVNRTPTSDNALANKKILDESKEDGTTFRFIQTLRIYIKVSVGNDTYNLSKYDEIKITDVTEIRFPNSGSDLLQKWKN